MTAHPLTKLTDKAVANLKPRPTRYQAFDEGCPGLSIRVTPTGGKSWVWQYREHVATTSGGYEPGKRQRFWTLGTYPALSLRDARALTEKARSLLKTRGVDPAVGKREASTAQTFGELATDYLDRHAKTHKKVVARRPAQARRGCAALLAVPARQDADSTRCPRPAGPRHRPWRTHRGEPPLSLGIRGVCVWHR